MVRKENSPGLTAARLAQLRCDVAEQVPGAWFKSFLAHAEVKRALAELDAADKSRDKWLPRAVVKSCYNAHTFDLARDPSVRRQQDKKYRADIGDALKAITKLRRFLDRHPDDASRNLGGALRDWNAYHGGKAHFPHVGATILSQFLEHYGLELAYEGAEEYKGRAALHRFQVGPLLYPKPLDQQHAQPDPRENGLCFELAYLIRHATASRDPVFPERIYQKFDRRPMLAGGASMPTFGRARAGNIASLVNAALGGKSRDENDVVQRLRRLAAQRATLWRWPPH
jgi:hypothetical protein